MTAVEHVMWDCVCIFEWFRTSGCSSWSQNIILTVRTWREQTKENRINPYQVPQPTMVTPLCGCSWYSAVNAEFIREVKASIQGLFICHNLLFVFNQQDCKNQINLSSISGTHGRLLHGNCFINPPSLFWVQLKWELKCCVVYEPIGAIYSLHMMLQENVTSCSLSPAY